MVVESVLPAAVRSVPMARRLVRDALTDPDLGELRDQVELAVSELVTNAVVHAGTEVTVRLAVAGAGVRVEVADGSARLPAKRSYATTARTGRGLQLVESSVDRWGVTPAPDGKTVWFEVGLDDAEHPALTEPQPPGAAADDPPVVEVSLLDVPVLMHWAWQEHAQSLLREYLLFRLDEDPGVLDQHAQASEALALLHEQIPMPQLPDDPHALLAETLEPDVTLARLAVRVPPPSVPHFATLDLVLGRATEAATAGHFLGPPTQPEIEEMREWLCDEVLRQAAGGDPSPWRTQTEVRTVLGDTDHLLEAYAELTHHAEHVLVTDEASIIVAVSESVARFLGYRTAADLVGRRIITVVPPRYHQAHIAGTTLNATNGRDVLLSVRITVPLLRADGTEAPVSLRVMPHILHGTRVFVADIVFAEDAVAS